MSKELATIFGTSASGKDTLLRQLASDPYYSRIINTTTRAPRHDEVDAQDYYFIDEDTHHSHVASNRYLTHTHAHGRYYGVLRSELEWAWQDKQLPIGHFGQEDHARIWQQNDEGLLCVRSLLLITPSFDIWQSRMQQRLETGLISTAEASSRAQTACRELAFARDNVDRFAVITTESVAATEAQVNDYLKYGEQTPHHDRLEVLIDQFTTHTEQQEQQLC